VSLEPDTNTVVVGEDEVLYHSGLVADSLNWISINQLSQPIKVEAKIRYRHEPAKARVDRTGEDKVRVTFVKPQRAITPGQAVVFYEGEMVVGGGVIRGVIKDE
jgi:tRNA-specific 2-thiouridylase